MKKKLSKFRIFQVVLGISIIIAGIAISYLISASPFVSTTGPGVSYLSILGLVFIFAGLFYKKREKRPDKEKPLQASRMSA